MTRTEAILNYLDEFPLIKRHNKTDYVSLEWIDKDIIFGINDNQTQNGGVVRRDVVGNVTKVYSFMFSAFFPYSQDVLSMIENSSFFEEFDYWLTSNNKNKILPNFGEDDGRYAISIRTVQTPFLFTVDPDNQTAQYSTIIEMIYKEKR